MENFDYGIIGGGPAGYTLAMLLAKQGKTIVLFEKDKIGGTCLNRGCIPTKAFLHSSEIYNSMFKMEGVTFDNVKLDFSKVVERKNNIVDKLRKSLELAVKNSGVKVVYKEAFIQDKNSIKACDEIYKMENIVIATGSKPR